MNHITHRIIECAVRVHRELGPGLLESAYDACLTFEFLNVGLPFERQKLLPVFYRGHHVDCGYRIDFIVEDQVIVEVKAVAHLEPVHKQQLLSYLRLQKRMVGLLFNFNVRWLTKEGMTRLVNGLPESHDSFSEGPSRNPDAGETVNRDPG